MGGDNDAFEDRIMQVMERALVDPEMNSTMKRIIDQENPDDEDSDNDKETNKMMTPTQGLTDSQGGCPNPE
eukprot:jgi/Psemu1/38193/gm1.38193_g